MILRPPCFVKGVFIFRRGGRAVYSALRPRDPPAPVRAAKTGESRLDIRRGIGYNNPRHEGNGLTSKGGDNVTVLETLALLNLIAVVVFGVISVMAKK